MATSLQTTNKPTGARILVIEDSALIRRINCDTLREFGYDPVAAPTATTGMRHLRMGKLHKMWRTQLVLLDLHLPDADGFELLRQIKTESERLPVIVLSSDANVGNRVHALRMGADDYLTKPCVPEELIARIDGQLRLLARYTTPQFNIYPAMAEVASPNWATAEQPA